MSIDDKCKAFKAYMKLQKIEIDEHKWYMSQSAGYDVGNNAAAEDYIRNYASRFRKYYDSHRGLIEKYCERCKSCSIDKHCMDVKMLHILLED